MKKLIEIQAELKAPKNQRNNFGKYNYRSCEDILEAVKPLLKASGLMLTITDEIREVGGLVFVESIARIDDGKDSVEVRAQAGINPDRKGMDIAQSFGSSSSYARKYALNGLFLIDDTKDADATNNHGKASKPVSQAMTQRATPISGTAQKPELKPKTDEWTKAIKYLVDGGIISAIEGKYALTEANKKSLMDEVLK
tara:strand:+ start:1155 stop:1745 length:591 start_codon:yes stop_codon:yes gene_type:complete